MTSASLATESNKPLTPAEGSAGVFCTMFYTRDPSDWPCYLENNRAVFCDLLAYTKQKKKQRNVKNEKR